MLDSFTISTFKADDVFKVHLGDENYMELKLSSVKAGRYKMPDASREPFSLIFKGPKSTWLPQDNYRMEHKTVGSFVICIVPILNLGGDGESYYYEANFS